MKKILLMAALLSSLGMSAQSEVGTFSLQPKVGMNVATLTDENGSECRIGFAAGAEVGYQVSKKVAITGGLIYSQQGVKAYYNNVEGTLKLDYINVPILANVYVVKGLALKAGIQPGFNVNKRVSAGGNSMDIDDALEGVLGKRVKLKTFDFSIPMGVSYEWRGLVVDARYNLGITLLVDKIEYKGSKVQPDDKNSVFQFTIGYKFAL